MIVIDYQNRKPIYEQIVERFQTLIITGAIEPDSQMPSVLLPWIYQSIRIRFRKRILSWSRRDIFTL